ENLGTYAGLVADAALLVDYVLTVSVSISAGVAAITSAALGTRFAWLNDHKVLLCLILIAFIAVANLRGVRESGALFAGPTYSFVISFVFMLGYGIIHYFIHPQAMAATNEGLKLAEGYHVGPLTWFLVLGAFSNGCVALTGTEAISNGILMLAAFAAVLVIGFGGDTSRLIPLYAVGVFLSFTLSQSGMVRHWLRAGRALKAASAANGQQDGAKPDAYHLKSTEAHQAK